MCQSLLVSFQSSQYKQALLSSARYKPRRYARSLPKFLSLAASIKKALNLFQLPVTISLLAAVFDNGLKLESQTRSEEHTSELQSRENLVCRLLLEKKKH